MNYKKTSILLCLLLTNRFTTTQTETFWPKIFSSSYWYPSSSQQTSAPSAPQSWLNKIMTYWYTTATKQATPKINSPAQPPIAATPTRTANRPQFIEKNITVLQQNSSVPWASVENVGDKTIMGTPGLFWKKTRELEHGNCGYHALKNISLILSAFQNPHIKLDQQLATPNSTLNKQLLDTAYFLQYFGSWAPQIYVKRQAIIVNDLIRKKITPPENMTDFKSYRASLPRSLQNYVHSGDGSIKVDYLGADEIEGLIKIEFPQFTENIIVIDYDPTINTDDSSTNKRIKLFQDRSHDLLGILWTEINFPHWIGIVAYKRNNTVTLYFTNSIQDLVPHFMNDFLLQLQP